MATGAAVPSAQAGATNMYGEYTLQSELLILLEEADDSTQEFFDADADSEPSASIQIKEAGNLQMATDLCSISVFS